jgi:DNA-binding LytR/AlgR family response regulator
MRVVIIEDELPSSRRLERMLSDFNYEITITLVSVKSAIKWFKTQPHPDLLFLDIQLSDGLCFEIFNAIEVKSPIVFTTAFSEYSIKAFDYNSISYLLKPIQKPQLKKAIEKAKTFHDNEKELFTLKAALENHKLSTYKTKFAVKLGKKIKLVNTEDIVCFFSLDNATYLKTDTSSYIINSALTILEEELNPDMFFQVNRKFIINITAIKSIVAQGNNKLKVTLNNYNELDIIVSRDRKKAFKEWLRK